MKKIDESRMLVDLYMKSSDYKFNEDEIKLIKKFNKKSDFIIKYGFYRKKSNKGCQIAFIIDQMPNATRKSGVENNWEIICKREISDLEYQEQVENFGTNTRRFVVWYYKNVDYLIEEDLKYNIKTPQKFIDECRKRGYNGTFQARLNF